MMVSTKIAMALMQQPVVHAPVLKCLTVMEIAHQEYGMEMVFAIQESILGMAMWWITTVERCIMKMEIVQPRSQTMILMDMTPLWTAMTMMPPSILEHTTFQMMVSTKIAMALMQQPVALGASLQK